MASDSQNDVKKANAAAVTKPAVNWGLIGLIVIPGLIVVSIVLLIVFVTVSKKDIEWSFADKTIYIIDLNIFYPPRPKGGEFELLNCKLNDIEIILKKSIKNAAKKAVKNAAKEIAESCLLPDNKENSADKEPKIVQNETPQKKPKLKLNDILSTEPK